MIVADIVELALVGTFDRGVPNKERIAILVNETVNLGQYGAMLGIRGAGASGLPIMDNLFWFGDGVVNKGDWIFIYTCPGTPTASYLPNSQARLFSLHWGRKITILHDSNIVPILFRVDAVCVDLTK